MPDAILAWRTKVDPIDKPWPYILLTAVVEREEDTSADHHQSHIPHMHTKAFHLLVAESGGEFANQLGANRIRD